jgi:hypothetical protein
MIRSILVPVYAPAFSAQTKAPRASWYSRPSFAANTAKISSETAELRDHPESSRDQVSDAEVAQAQASRITRTSRPAFFAQLASFAALAYYRSPWVQTSEITKAQATRAPRFAWFAFDPKAPEASQVSA